MIPTLVQMRQAQPNLTRLGFHDGWLILRPTFLNLRRPVVVVDQAFTGDPQRYGLEPFGSRDPHEPLPITELTICTFGNAVSLRSRSTGEVIANTFLAADAGVTLLNSFTMAVIILGSTYSLELSWAALWSMSIGLARHLP